MLHQRSVRKFGWLRDVLRHRVPISVHWHSRVCSTISMPTKMYLLGGKTYNWTNRISKWQSLLCCPLWTVEHCWHTASGFLGMVGKWRSHMSSSYHTFAPRQLSLWNYDAHTPRTAVRLEFHRMVKLKTGSCFVPFYHNWWYDKSLASTTCPSPFITLYLMIPLRQR